MVRIYSYYTKSLNLQFDYNRLVLKRNAQGWSTATPPAKKPADQPRAAAATSSGKSSSSTAPAVQSTGPIAPPPQPTPTGPTSSTPRVSSRQPVKKVDSVVSIRNEVDTIISDRYETICDESYYDHDTDIYEDEVEDDMQNGHDENNLTHPQPNVTGALGKCISILKQVLPDQDIDAMLNDPNAVPILPPKPNPTPQTPQHEEEGTEEEQEGEDGDEVVEEEADDQDVDEIFDTNIESLFSDKWSEELVPKHLTAPVSDILAQKLKKWVTSPPSKDELNQTFKACLIPKNCEALMPVNIDNFLYQKIPAAVRVADKKLTSTATYFRRSLGRLMPMWADLCESEIVENLTGDPQPPLRTRHGDVPMAKVLDGLVDVIKLLSYGLSLINVRRRHGMRPYIDQKFHPLLAASNPISTTLLGDNLENKVSDISKLNSMLRRQSQSMLRVRRPFFSQRSRGHPARGYFTPSPGTTRRPTRGRYQTRGNPRYNRRFTRRSRPGRAR